VEKSRKLHILTTTNTEGNAMTTIKGINGRDLIISEIKKPILPYEPECCERVMILTGKRKKPDILSWNGSGRLADGDYKVCCQGLYKGRYGDAEVRASDLYAALEIDAPREAQSFKRAWNAWNQ